MNNEERTYGPDAHTHTRIVSFISTDDTLFVDTEFNISGEESHIRVPAADRSGEGDSGSRNGGGGDGRIA